MRRRAILAALLVTAGLGAASIATWNGPGQAAESSQASPQTLAALTVGGPAPIPEAQSVPVQDAEARFGYHLYRPSDWVAGDGTLSRCWIQEDNGQVALVYQSGLTIYLQVSTLGDPAAFFQEQQREGNSGDIKTILGVPALVTPPAQGLPGSVELVLGGLDIQMVGHGDFTTEDLTRIASSFQ